MKTIRFLAVLMAASVALPGCIGNKVETETKMYAVTVILTDGGIAEAEPGKAAEGTKITLTADPDPGYLFETWTVVSGELTLEDPTANPAEFTMPAEDVEVSAEFVKNINILPLITDDIFRKYCSPFDTDGNGKLSIEEAREVKEISVVRMDISSLAGIEYFTSLESLICNSNPLNSLDVSKLTALTALSCSNCQLETLDLSENTELITLKCVNNPLTKFDLSKCSALTTLWCDQCGLQTLDIRSNTELTSVSITSNSLTSIDLSSNTKLVELDCSDNKLTSLDISKNTALNWFHCYVNRLSVLDATSMAFDEEGKYTLWCGQQRDDAGDAGPILTITLRDDMKDFWNNTLKLNGYNNDVALAD